MKNNDNSASLSRIKEEMAILRESFQALDESMSAMFTALPDSEREILQNRWKLTTKNFEDMFFNYMK